MGVGWLYKWPLMAKNQMLTFNTKSHNYADNCKLIVEVIIFESKRRRLSLLLNCCTLNKFFDFLNILFFPQDNSIFIFDKKGVLSTYSYSCVEMLEPTYYLQFDLRKF